MSLVILGASRNTARAASALETPIYHAGSANNGIEELLRPGVDDFFPLDFQDSRQLRAFSEHLRTSVKPEAVVSVTELGLLPAAELSESLGTPGTPAHVVELMRDKLLMRRQLSLSAPELTVRATTAADEDTVKEILSHYGAAILKPVNGVASVGVHKFSTFSEFTSFSPDWRRSGVVEGFIEGAEFGVESFSKDGDHEVVTIVERRKTDNFIELGHITPPPSLSERQVESVQAAVAKMLDVLGLKNGPAHTEVILQAEQVTLVETHNRPSGEGVADLVQATKGLEWRLAVIGWPIGHYPTRQAPRARAAASVFFTAPAGTVTSTMDQAPKLDGAVAERWGVNVSVGDTVGEPTSNYDRLGFARIIADSSLECANAVDEVLSMPVVSTAIG